MITKLKITLRRDVHLSELFTGSVVAFLLKMFGMLLSYLLIYVTTQKVGLPGVGYYNLFYQSLVVLAMVLGLGMSTSVLRYVGQFNNPEEQYKLRSLYKFIWRTVGPLSCVVSILLFFGSDILVKTFGKSEEFGLGIKYSAIALPLFTLNQISIEFLRGLKKIQFSEFLRSVIIPLLLIVGLLLFQQPMEKNGLILLLMVSIVISSAVSYLTIRVKLRTYEVVADDLDKKGVLAASSAMMISSVSNALSLALPLFVIEFFFDQSHVGVFSLAFRLSTMVSMILFIVNTMAAPKISELFWAKKNVELQRLINTSSKLMFWMAFLWTLFFVFFGKLVLGWFGKEYITGYWILVILVLGQFVNTITGSVGVFLNMSGNQKVQRNTQLIFLVVSIFLYALLVPLLGPIGASVVYTISIIGINLSGAIVAYNKLGVRTFYMPLLTRVVSRKRISN